MEIKELKRIFNYDSGSGILTWKINTGKKRLVGLSAGTVRKDGYMRVGINKKDYYVHRIAWAITHGTWPKINIDHINGNPSDNRIDNLREATQSQNIANSKSKITRGVYTARGGRYRAQIMVNYKSIHLGQFSTRKEAKAAYSKAALDYFGEFRRPS
jgi:hypothetical protein